MHLRAAVLSFAVLPLVVHATPLSDLETARAQANAHFQASDARVKAVSTTLAEASKSLRSCHNGALQFQFTGALAKLEISRRALEKGRRETQSLRQALEAVRTQLEAGRARGTAPTPEAAVAAEQVYAERLLTDYVRPLDGTLVPLVDAYTTGVSAYSQALTDYAAFCAKPGYTAAVGAAFVSQLQPAIDALSSKSEQLVTAVAEAKRATTDRAVSAK